jgi:putative ABC transport system permease protein
MFENVSLAFQGIWSHKLRSFLTMLGIIIGIASIIIIVSTIKGTNEMIKSNLVGSGTNVVNVRLFQGDNAYDMEYNAVPEGIAPITEDIRQSLADMKNVESVSLYHSRTYTDGVYYRDTSFSGNLYGVDAYFLDANGYRVTYGRGLLQSDVDARHKVVLLDTGAAAALSIDGNPIGQTLEIKGEPYTIIGVVNKTTQFKPVIETMDEYYQYMDTSSGSIFVPDSTWPEIYRFDEPLSVAVKATSTDDMTSVGQSAADYLTEQVVLNTQSKFSYRSEDLLEQAKKLQELSSSTNKQLIWIASISLLVGGIGVMNIMLVSVTERTREIGLKKAIGAKRRRILWQFLTEASVMTSLGGILGVGAGIGIARLVSNVMGTPTAVSVPAIVVAVAFSMLIGVVFGLIPALKASKLNPIDALRRE